MANDTDDDLPGLCVREIQHTIITYADTPAISIPELFAPMRKRIVLERQDRFGNAGLNLRG